MSEPQDRDVVDLRRYREASRRRAQLQKAADAKAGHPPPRGEAPILGGRRHAGLILLAAAILFLVLWVGPQLVR